jgi:hydroxymethylbilane synthase
MIPKDRLVVIATRGSALALAQAEIILTQCCGAFPQLKFEIKIIKTTGDNLQTASLSKEGESLPKGLFTKELEVALLERRADLAVHSLKDLPTSVPPGLKLGAISKRADVRDVLIYRDAKHLPLLARKTGEQTTRAESKQRGFKPGMLPRDFPAGAVIASSSTRRKAQILEKNPDLKVMDIRGNVLTRLQKLADRAEMDATLLAMAGLQRLNFTISPLARLEGTDVPEGLLATVLEPEVMLPCVGQGAIGIEIRTDDPELTELCERLDDYDTRQCVTAERAFLAGMGGGCQSPVAAMGVSSGGRLRLTALSFADGPVRRTIKEGALEDATALGTAVAQELLAKLR